VAGLIWCSSQMTSTVLLPLRWLSIIAWRWLSIHLLFRS